MGSLWNIHTGFIVWIISLKSVSKSSQIFEKLTLHHLSIAYCFALRFLEQQSTDNAVLVFLESDVIWRWTSNHTDLFGHYIAIYDLMLAGFWHNK